jgi:myo-inositol-1(or 4)-monophosphatase
LGLFSVSIAFFYKNEASVGIVFNPVSAELFTATKNKGAQLNNQPIHVSNKKVLKESLLVTGFPYNLNTILTPLITRFQNCLSASQGVRRLGSAALDLCYVACGRFDGYWEENLNPWDTAAGVLIAQEAGAIATDFKNRPFHIKKKQILVTNGHIHSEIMTLLNSEDSI